MLKIKTFDEEHEEELEKSVNKFFLTIDEKNFIDIKYSIAAFLSNSGEQIYCYSALILYRTDPKK